MNRLIVLIIFMSYVAHNCFAAAPLVHLCLASKYLELHGRRYTSEQKNSFLRGTSFPDIRYLAHIPRERTHDSSVTLQTIYTTPSPFEAGKKFHVWVDEQREQFMKDWKMYDTLNKIDNPPQKQKALFLKLIEDAVLFNNSTNKTIDAITLFSTIDAEEKNYGIRDEKLRQWHAILTIYLSIQTTWFLKFSALLISNTPSNWSDQIPKLAQEKVFTDYVTRLLGAFEKKFNELTPI